MKIQENMWFLKQGLWVSQSLDLFLMGRKAVMSFRRSIFGEKRRAVLGLSRLVLARPNSLCQLALLLSLACFVTISSPVLANTDSTALLSNPGSQILEEEQSYTINVIARPGARIFVRGMPPGMLWDEVNRRFDFRPDFIQGGTSWQITMDAVEGTETDTQVFTVTVNNTIQPPWPEFVEREELYKVSKVTVRQVTDDFLDSPGHAGRVFTANLAIPTAASATNRLPVWIGLHGFGGSPGTVGRAGHFGIAPHDVNNTWWTGYNDLLPRDTIDRGTNPNYTQRRVMHLLSYLMENCPGLEGNCPGVNPERIGVTGTSMGGTGSFFMAINYGYHFAQISSRLGATIPYFLTTGAKIQLTRYWGSANLELPGSQGINVWEQYDSSRALLNNKSFRNLHFTTVSGQNDSVIPFAAMVGTSPLTGKSFLEVLQNKEGVGHFSVWDQRAHGGKDPSLRAIWWEPLDDASFLRRNLAFPAFSNGSADDDAGELDDRGGYTGTLRGAKNRYLRWDSASIIDTRDQLSIPIKADISSTGSPPDAGFPAEKNSYFGPLPITADVTTRRVQQFQTRPGEAVNWNYNGNSGTVMANDDGSVTVPGLAMATGFTPLVLTRAAPGGGQVIPVPSMPSTPKITITTN